MLLTHRLVAQSTNSKNNKSASREYTLYNNTAPFQVIHKLHKDNFHRSGFSCLHFLWLVPLHRRRGRNTHTYFHFLIQNLWSQITNIYLLKFQVIFSNILPSFLANFVSWQKKALLTAFFSLHIFYIHKPSTDKGVMPVTIHVPLLVVSLFLWRFSPFFYIFSPKWACVVLVVFYVI